MTNFDDLAKSSAENGSLFKAWRANRAAEHEVVPSMTRRQLMKRAGVVGAATVWATPLIQSVMTPAWAVVSCTPNCAVGRPCGVDADCLSKNCTAGICKPARSNVTGTPCSTGGTTLQQDQSCVSGYCELTTNICLVPPTGLAQGASCHGATPTIADNECTSQICNGINKCAA